MTQLALASSAQVQHWLSATARRIAQRRDFVAGGIEAAHRHLAQRTDGRCALVAQDPSRFRAFGSGEVRLADTAIRFLHCEATTACRKSTQRAGDAGRVILQCVLSGQMAVEKGNRRVQVRAGQALITGSAGEIVKRWSGACAMLNIVMPGAALARLMAEEEAAPALWNATDFAGHALDGMRIVELGLAAALAQFVSAVVCDLSEHRSAFATPRAAAQAEEALHRLALKSFAVAGEAAHDPATSASAVPFYVRRAEAYMIARLGEPLDLLTLAEHSGVSPRTLQYGFKLHRDMAPMAYLRTLRLAAARRHLIAAQCGDRAVADVARQCGYVSLSHFARDYRASFGESPRRTLRGI